MILADWIVLGVFLVLALIGLIAGFGKSLKFFTSGIFGVIISVVVCYFLYGIVINWQFVQDLMDKLIGAIGSANNGFCDFLLDIHIEIIIVCIAMFIIVQILRVILVLIIKNVAELRNPVFRVINKMFGMILILLVGAAVLLMVFQIISWVGGETAQLFVNEETGKGWLDGSFFKLDWLFINNPVKPWLTSS